MSRLSPENFSTPLKFLNPTKILNPLLKISQPSRRKFLTPPPTENFSTPQQKKFSPPPPKISQPSRKFLTHPPPPPKISHPPPPPPENFSTSLKISQPHSRKSQPKKYVNNEPPPLILFLCLFSTSFPSLFKENLKIDGGGGWGLNPHKYVFVQYLSLIDTLYL